MQQHAHAQKSHSKQITKTWDWWPNKPLDLKCHYLQEYTEQELKSESDWLHKRKITIVHISLSILHFSGLCNRCLYLYVIVALRLAFRGTPHCSESANYLLDLTPNKSNLSGFMLNRLRFTGVLHRWNIAYVTQSASPFVPCFHPSRTTSLCLKSHLFYLRISFRID